MELILIRHLKTPGNEKRQYIGSTDEELSEQEVLNFKQKYKIDSYPQVEQVIVSPMKRCIQTAELIYPKNQITQEELLKECDFGIFEGLTYKQLKGKYPQELEQWNKEFSTYRIPEGESFLDVRRRVEAFLKDIPSGEENKSEKMLITAHKGTLGHLLAAMLKLPPEGYWNFVFDQGCYSEVDLEDGYAIIRKLNVRDIPRDI